MKIATSLSLIVLATILNTEVSFSTTEAVAAGRPKVAATSCKTGFKKAKTPVSLVPGAKVGCYNVKQAATGKNLLTKLQTKSCYTCHSSIGISPASQMNNNLRTQGFTLKTSDILAAFNAHVAEMAGATVSNADVKAISQYLQSIK